MNFVRMFLISSSILNRKENTNERDAVSYQDYWGGYLNSPMVVDALERHKFDIDVRTIDKPTDCPQLRVDWHDGDKTKNTCNIGKRMRVLMNTLFE